ncbi:MAG: hypothetical protein GKC10_03285 [Methanosarcinales archaeon]|nr:hypothetical protein [Methanosarcinales archaeon]
MLIVLAFFLMGLTLAQPTQVGGDFGKSWLDQYGDEPVILDKPETLWTWGSIPKGQMLIGGKLEPIGDLAIFYPAFPVNNTPLYLNRTELRGATDLASPYLTSDPFFVAQTTGQPIILRTF